jgi:hypothetical protein
MSDSSGNHVSSDNHYTKQVHPNTLLGAISMDKPQTAQSPKFSAQTLLGKTTNQSKPLMDGPFIDIEDTSTIHVERGLIQNTTIKTRESGMNSMMTGPFVDPDDYSKILLERGALQQNDMKRRESGMNSMMTGPFVDPDDYSKILLERGALQQNDLKKSESIEQVFESNTLVGRLKERPISMAPYIQPSTPNISGKSGTLLESMRQPKPPAISQPSDLFGTGLLAEAQRKKKEDKEWKKNLTLMANTSGTFTPRMTPTNTGVFSNNPSMSDHTPMPRTVQPSVHSSDAGDDTPEVVYYREMLRQQFLMHERYLS